MLKNKKLQRVLVVALILALGAAVPMEAKPSLWQRAVKWVKAHKAEIMTIAGVGTIVGGILGGDEKVVDVGVELIKVQGSMLKTSAGIAGDPNLAESYLGPQICDDGGVACTAAQGILKMEIPPQEIPEGTEPQLAAFKESVNRVIEAGDVFSRHCEENASLEVKQQALAEVASAVEAAADAYDELGLSLELTQAGIDSFQQETRESGLPPVERAFWENAGLSRDEIDAVAKFLGTTELQMPIPSISVSDLLHNAAQGFVPSSK